jgi:hypothetical protein
VNTPTHSVTYYERDALPSFSYHNDQIDATVEACRAVNDPALAIDAAQVFAIEPDGNLRLIATVELRLINPDGTI